MSTTTSSTQSSLKAYLAWFTCALFFFYQYILRVAPGVMIDDLRFDYNLTAEQFSTFGAYYLYAYSLFQIPLGALVDRVGIRRMVLGSIALCMGGAFLFASTHSFYGAQFSRALIGLGSAAAFMGALKIAADYFPDGKRGLLMGVTLSLGTVGALTAGKPLVLLLEEIGWRDTVSFTAFLGAPLLLMSVFLLPAQQKKTRKNNEADGSFKERLVSILKNRMVMLYTLLAIGLYTPLSALADLWGTAFLMQKYDLSQGDAAQTSMMMYLGMAAGSLILPWFCEKYHILNRGIQACGFSLLVLMAVVLYAPAFNILIVTFLLLGLGFFCGAEMMCFTGAVAYTTPSTSGLTLGMVNTLNMLGGALLQQLIGFGLDWQWGGDLSEKNIRLYSTEEFVFALSALLVVISICCLASLGLKKKINSRLG